MCEHCLKHGEGKKWYLNVKNYSEELFHSHKKSIEGVVFDGDTIFPHNLRGVNTYHQKYPFLKNYILRRTEKELKKLHFSQVITLEDVNEILHSIVRSVVRFPCICRKMLYDKKDERLCYGIAINDNTSPAIYAKQSLNYDCDLEVMTTQSAYEAIKDHQINGNVSTVWTFGMPFIGVICNCNLSDCVMLKIQAEHGTVRSVTRGEYVAQVDPDKCNGCKECLKVCNFGAISFSSTMNRARINQFQCWGCGICRLVCQKDAISLKDRNKLPALKDVWY